MDTQRLWNRLKDWRAIAPYLLIELFLPGGTLLAFLLWLSQRVRSAGLHRGHRPAAQQSQIAVAADQRASSTSGGEVAFDAGCPFVR